MKELLFVYGILRGGQILKTIHEDTKYISKGNTPGYLYDLGPFPAAIFSVASRNIVAGEIFSVPSSVLKETDIIEGTSIDFYRRIKIRVKTKEDRHINCWAYEFGNIPLLEEKGRLVVSGDYKKSAW